MRTLLAALAATALLAPAAQASDPQVMDGRGDANGLNNQGVLPVDLTVTLPYGVDPYDLLSVRFTTTKQAKRVTGFTATLLLAAAPEPSSNYVVKTSAPGCAEIWLDYLVNELGDAEGRLRHRCAGGLPSDPGTWVDLKTETNGTSVRFTVPLAALPKGVGAGTVLGGLGAESRVFAAAASPLRVDVAASDATYRIGS